MCWLCRVLVVALLSAVPGGIEQPNSEKSLSQKSAANESDSLSLGIPGEGPLRTEEIRAWLADPRNHAVIAPPLPVGLDAGAKDLQGLAENPLTRAKIELGRQLFFDPRLSSNGAVSCASCHDPDHGYAAPTQFGVGVGGLVGKRNSPAAYNRLLSSSQFLDGRAASLEEQAIGPIANPIEMGSTHEACVERLAGIEGYRLQFDHLFGDGVTIGNVGRALASFERVLVTGPTPWDHHQRLASFEETYADDLAYPEDLAEEDPELLDEHAALRQAATEHPLSPAARRGGVLFFNPRGRCAQCHTGANFTDEQYHNLGVGLEGESPDLGRFNVTGVEADRGAFKTPTIRCVTLTAPYMHDGSQATLEEVVAWYVKGGHANPQLSNKIQKLDLSQQEQRDLVAFMEALTSELPKVERGRLPEESQHALDR